MAVKIYNDKLEAIVPDPKEIAERIKLEVNRAVERLSVVDEELRNKVEQLEVSVDPKEISSGIKLEVDRVIERFIVTNEELKKKIDELDAYRRTDKIVIPDYAAFEPPNKFSSSSTKWSSDRDGFVLIKVRGLCDFRVLINSVEIISKLPESDSPLRSDVEVFFTQVLQVRTNDLVEVKKEPSSLDEMVCSCQFIPNKIIDVTLM